MNLFNEPEINIAETTDKVDKYLRNHLEKVALMAGHRLTDLSSPTLSNAPAHSNGTNVAERTITRGMYAELLLNAINDTIHHCNPPFDSILIEYYIKQNKRYEVANHLNMSVSSLDNKKGIALLQFAYGFEHWQLVNAINSDDIVNLLVYSK